MSARFRPGSKAYAKDGRVFIVEAIEGSMVYCSQPNGSDAEFPESALVTAQEWEAQSDGRRDAVYARIRHAMQHIAARTDVDRGAAEQFLTQADHLIPGLLDFVAFTVAARAVPDVADQLSIVKCRKLFDALTPGHRLAGTSGVLGLPAEKLIGAARLGDNMAKAMIETGLSSQAEAFEEFCDRPRR
jgi:hypothetical protein